MNNYAALKGTQVTFRFKYALTSHCQINYTLTSHCQLESSKFHLRPLGILYRACLKNVMTDLSYIPFAAYGELYPIFQSNLQLSKIALNSVLNTN